MIAAAIAMIVMGVLLWFQLRNRTRRFGGGRLAAAATALAVVGLLVSITNALPTEIGFVVLLLSLFAIYRPEQVVKATGGPSLAWRALREGRELQLLVKERGGPSLAKRNPEVQERFEALSGARGTGDAYLHRAAPGDAPGGPGGTRHGRQAAPSSRRRTRSSWRRSGRGRRGRRSWNAEPRQGRRPMTTGRPAPMRARPAEYAADRRRPMRAGRLSVAGRRRVGFSAGA